MRKIYFICLTVLISISTFAQVDFKQQYFNGKNFFREGKYNLAMESFKRVIPYDQSNPFSEYASFYYSLSAYYQGYLAVAKDMLNQMKSLYPKWDKMDEVNLWLAKIHFDNKDYFQGFKLLNAIESKSLQPEISLIKKQALNQVQDVETLRMMSEEYSKDEMVGTSLAKILAKNPGSAEDQALLESLISKFNLNRSEFIPEAPKTFFKDLYSVSVLLPFMVSTLDPSPAKKRNQVILDIYQGMKLAVDTLAEQSININLRAYDTERSSEKIRKVLDTEELKNTDLIVGPYFQEENKAVQDFSLNNKINVFSPTSNNSENNGTNPYAFLFQPSYETLGKKSGEFLSGYAKRKNCMVFYGGAKRDSILAANFIQKATEGGLKILSAQKITRDVTGRITSILATPTEFDEFKYPIEFTLKRDSIGSIYVASDDALIYSKVVNGIETRRDSIILLGSENWLEQTGIDFEKYGNLGVVLAAPNFTKLSNPNYLAFVRKFMKAHGRVPSNYSKLGYEFMLFAGHELKNHGVYFQEGLNQETAIPGYLSSGYNFQFARDNQLVPFVKFDNGELIMVGKP